MLSVCTPTCQKRASDPFVDEPLDGCQELNSEPLGEQLVFLTAGPSQQPDFSGLLRTILLVCGSVLGARCTVQSTLTQECFVQWYFWVWYSRRPTLTTSFAEDLT